jgi:hypothetical protein
LQHTTHYNRILGTLPWTLQLTLPVSLPQIEDVVHFVCCGQCRWIPRDVKALRNRHLPASLTNMLGSPVGSTRPSTALFGIFP